MKVCMKHSEPKKSQNQASKIATKSDKLMLTLALPFNRSVQGLSVDKIRGEGVTICLAYPSTKPQVDQIPGDDGLVRTERLLDVRCLLPTYSWG